MFRYKSLKEQDTENKDPMKVLQLAIGDSQHIVDDLNYKIKRANDAPEPNQDAIKKLRDQLKIETDNLIIKRKKLEILKLQQKLDNEKEVQKQAKEREKDKDGYER